MSGIVRSFWKDYPMTLPMDINVTMIIPEILKLKEVMHSWDPSGETTKTTLDLRPALQVP